MSEYLAYLNVAQDVIPVTLQEAATSVTISVLSGATLTVWDNQELQNPSTITAGNNASFTQNVWVQSASHSSIQLQWTPSSVSVGGPVQITYVTGQPGDPNIAIGGPGYLAITTGWSNIAINGGHGESGGGPGAMTSATTAHDNVAIGDGSMPYVTTGNSNTAVGSDTFALLTSGVSNTAVGNGALANTTGNYNTAVGQGALLTEAAGGSNTAVGQNAANLQTGCTNNVAIGCLALTANVVGSQNTAIGMDSLAASNATNGNNTAVGWASGYGLTTGTYNTMLGVNAGRSVVTSSFCTVVGATAGYTTTTDHAYMTLIGYGTIGTGGGACALGVDSNGHGASAGPNQVAIGTYGHTTLFQAGGGTPAGGVVINGSGAALATTATAGFLHIPSCAGAPTGVPTLYTGAVPMVFDTTDSKLYIYTGGAWTAGYTA